MVSPHRSSSRSKATRDRDSAAAAAAKPDPAVAAAAAATATLRLVESPPPSLSLCLARHVNPSSLFCTAAKTAAGPLGCCCGMAWACATWGVRGQGRPRGGTQGGHPARQHMGQVIASAPASRLGEADGHPGCRRVLQAARCDVHQRGSPAAADTSSQLYATGSRHASQRWATGRRHASQSRGGLACELYIRAGRPLAGRR